LLSYARLLPLLHNARGGERTWRELGIVESRVREVNAVIEHGSKELWAFISEELDRAVSDGFSRRPSAEALARTPIVPEIRGLEPRAQRRQRSVAPPWRPPQTYTRKSRTAAGSLRLPSACDA
jgi:hypothetical protein